MTNGEKIETILNVDRDCTEVHGENGTMTFTVTQDFWNAEYKEPTTKNNLGVEKTDMIDKSNFSQEQYKADLQSAYDCGYEQAKNDLGVECVSRKEVEKLVYRFLQKGTDENIAFYEHFLDLPSVTPQLSSELEKDFGELDCISRADAIQAMQDKAKKLTNEDTINGLCGAVAILYEMSPVTPQEPILDKIFCIIHPLSIMSTPELEHKAIMQIAEMLEPLCLPESEG